MARIIIPIKTDKQLEHIRKAESQLSKAGVTFDTDSELRNGKILNRCWSLDWSLSGALIENDKEAG